MKTTIQIPIFSKCPNNTQLIKGATQPAGIPTNILREIQPNTPDTIIELKRTQDDHDGDKSKKLEMMLSHNEIKIRYPIEHTLTPCCFRHPHQGTNSFRTGNGIRLLWYAIYLQQEQKNPKNPITIRKYKTPTSVREILRILETYWSPKPWFECKVNTYQTCSDDSLNHLKNEFGYANKLSIQYSSNINRCGDVFLDNSYMEEGDPWLYYKSPEIGGHYPFIYYTLQILAFAIYLDEILPKPKHPAN